MYYKKRPDTQEKVMSHYNQKVSKNSVLVILFYITSSGEILTVLVCAKNRKPPLWKIIGGKVEEGESIIKAGERETFEETGLKIEKTTIVKRIQKKSHMADVPIHHQFILFSQVKDITTFTPTAIDDEDILKTEFFNIDEIFEYLKSPKPIKGHKLLTPHANIYRDLFVTNRHITEEIITRNFS